MLVCETKKIKFNNSVGSEYKLLNQNQSQSTRQVGQQDKQADKAGRFNRCACFNYVLIFCMPKWQGSNPGQDPRLSFSIKINQIHSIHG
jgi:hypothetical protein